jgi:hypothetical protein
MNILRPASKMAKRPQAFSRRLRGRFDDICELARSRMHRFDATNSALDVRRILGKTSGAPILRGQSMTKRTAKASSRLKTGV